MNIPLFDLKAQYQSLRSEILSAIEATCDEQGFILGPRVVALEEAVAAYVGSTHAVGWHPERCLVAGVDGLGVKAGDEGDHGAVHLLRNGRGDFSAGCQTGLHRYPF